MLSFYARRIRRILPAAIVTIVMTLTAAVFVYPPIGLPRVIGDAVGALLYVPNIVFASRATDYLADHSPSPFQHFWSLGVEEQFYLLWPLALTGFVWLGARRRTHLLAAVGLLVTASFAYGFVVTQVDQPTAFFILPTRAWELLAGALVAIAASSWPNRAAPAVASIGAWSGLAIVIVSMFVFDSQTPVPGLAAGVPVVGACVVLLFGQRSVGLTTVMLIRPVQFIGLISYSLYLVHWPLLVLTQVAVGEDHPLQVRAKVILMVAVGVPLAWLVFRFVETPFRSTNRAMGARPFRVVLAAVITTLVLVACAIGLNAWASNREGTLGPPVSDAPTRPLQPVPLSKIAPSNLIPQLEDAARSLPDMYSDGCHASPRDVTVKACIYGDADALIKVAIFGDSHAAQWLPAMQRIAESRSLQIKTYTKSSCPAVEATVLNNTVPDHGCDRWRAHAISELVGEAPDLVVISDESTYPLQGVADADRADRWGDALRATVSQLVNAGSEVAVIANTPRQRVMPADCVSAHPRDVEQCAAPRNEAVDLKIAVAEQAAAEATGASYVDLNDYICGSDRCPVVVANLLVYRDTHHLSTPYARYLSPALESAIEFFARTSGR